MVKYGHITLLLIKVETSYLHHFEAFEYSVKKENKNLFSVLHNQKSHGGQISCVFDKLHK